MNRKPYHEILDSAAADSLHNQANLWPKISAQLGKRKSLMQTIRTRPLLLVLIVILILLLLTGAAYAIGNMIGYIPGIGFVNRSAPIRVLAGPVSMTRDGVTLQVSQAVLTSDKTVLVFTLDGVQWDMLSHDEKVTGCTDTAKLGLPDGTLLDANEGGGNGYESRFAFDPIAANTNEAKFILPCIRNTLPGKAPENWELPLRFVPAPPEMTVIPVIEIQPTPQPAVQNATAQPSPVTLLKVLQIGDRYILLGTFDQSASASGWHVMTGYQLTDANGRDVPFTMPAEQGLPNFDWAFEMNGRTAAFPVTMTFSGLHISYIDPGATAEFDFDAGPDPRAGQTWQIDRDFEIAGHKFRLVSITADSQGGYDFSFTSDEAQLGVNVGIQGYTPNGGGGGGGGPANNWSVDVSYAKLPKGRLKVIFSNLSVADKSETWKIQWSPENPPVPATSTPLSASGPCLTLETWQELADQIEPLPDGVRGKLVTTINEGAPQPAVYVSTMDGTSSTRMGTATWPSLSTNGMLLAYSGADGIYIRNLSSGETHAIGMDGYRIIWSPDDTRLMFTNTFNLYVVNTDGSGLQKIDIGPTQVVSPAGWLPDNQTIVYGMLAAEGFHLKSYNLQSGERKALFQFHNKAGYGAISPDGGWIVFADRASDATNWGIYVSRLDGSQRKLIADPEVPTAFSSVWGPDGQWLILNTQNRKEKQVSILVNPFTCRAAHLNLDGFVESWGP